MNWSPGHPLSSLLRLSWEAAVLVVLVLAVQWVLGARLSPRWRYGLWLLVVLRLALPWSIPSPLSLFNYLDFSKAAAPPISRVMESMAAAPAQDTLPAPTGVKPISRWNLSWGLPLTWAAGAIGLQMWMIATHLRLARHVTRRRPLIDPPVLNLLEDCKQLMDVHVPVSLVETDGVDAPCLFGFLRPRLLLPPDFTRNFSLDELRHVFLHELGHIKRQDILLGWLMAFLQILHWFNPLVWLAFARMRAERELACDALALTHAGDQENKPYGRTMVKLLESFGDSLRAPSLAGIVEGKQQMRERIRMIATFQRANRGTALAGILFVSLGLLTLTDAKPGTTATSTAGDDTPGPPHIVKTIPTRAATDVDPGLKEITVVFDQDMQKGYSWTGGGPDFPTAPDGAKAHWRNKRTCVLPVKLEAAHYYRVGINSTSYQSFASARGVPAMPSAIFFTTKGASAELKALVRLPQIVRFEPDNGAQEVSLATTEVRVTFNVPMGGGYSWCTAGDDDHDFPQGVKGKKIHWTDDQKTCVLPVALQPGMTYRISLNAPGFKNFQSAGGVPLDPVAYTFKTSGTPQAGPTRSTWGEEQQKDFSDGNQWAAYKLWDAYYRGHHGVDRDAAQADKWLREFVKDTWVVTFEPVDDFAPATPEVFLGRLNDYAHTYSESRKVGMGSFFRTTKRGGKLVGSFLTNYPDEFKARLEKVPGVKFGSAEKLTPEKFIQYEESEQESL